MHAAVTEKDGPVKGDSNVPHCLPSTVRINSDRRRKRRKR